MNHLRFAIATLTLLLLAAPADAGTVAIVQPRRPTSALTETVSRLHGELLSVGLNVRLIAPPADPSPDRTDSRAWIEAIAAEGRIDAVIDVVGDNAPVWVDVWVIEKSPRRLELSRVASDPNTANASERLAIRAIEVLRSSFLESDMSDRERRRVPAANTTAASQPPSALDATLRRPGQVGLEVGAAVLAGQDGLGPAILPVLQLDWAPRTWLVVHGTLAGLGTRPGIATTAGHARVTRLFGVLGGSFRFRSDKALNPFIAVTAGALRTLVEGEADLPRQGHTVTQWSLLLDGSVGAALRLSERYFLTLAAHVQLAEPYVAVRFVDAVVATTGRPTLAFTLTVGAWL